MNPTTIQSLLSVALDATAAFEKAEAVMHREKDLPPSERSEAAWLSYCRAVRANKEAWIAYNEAVPHVVGYGTVFSC